MAYRTLFVINSASHGHGTQAKVEGDVEEHEAMDAFTAPTKTKPRNQKTVRRGRDTTLLVASSSLCIELASPRRHVQLEKDLKVAHMLVLT